MHPDPSAVRAAFRLVPLSSAALLCAMSVASCDKNPVQPNGVCASIPQAQRSIEHGADAGTVSVSITGAVNCSWTATVSGSFLSLASAASGTGNGVIVLNVSENASAERVGTVAVGGAVATIRQAAGVPCEFSVSPLQLRLPSDQADTTVTVALKQGRTCPWTASSSDSFLTITNGASGVGSGEVRIAAASNNDVSRIGRITVAGQTVDVNQDGACRFDLWGPNTFNVSPETSYLNVLFDAVPYTCRLNAASTSPFLHFTLTHFEFEQVVITIDANFGPARTGLISVGGHTLTINQAGR